jgi:hypothetical protein
VPGKRFFNCSYTALAPAALRGGYFCRIVENQCCLVCLAASGHLGVVYAFFQLGDAVVECPQSVGIGKVYFLLFCGC